MNRGIALFVALAVLIAHVLAIFNDGTGGVALPYDQSYVAYRLAHNLVFEGQLQWNPGMEAFESHSSVVWVTVCAIGERLNASLRWLSINFYCQSVGLGSMLVTVLLLAQLGKARSASLIAPLILVCSGCAAAAAVNGLDTALFTLFVVALLLAFERGRNGLVFIFSALVVLTRPEGVVFVAALCLCWPFARTQAVRGSERTRRLWPLIGGLLTFAGACLVRRNVSGFVLPPVFDAVLHPAPGQQREGLLYVADFVRTCPIVLLASLAVGLALLRRLSGVGMRALVLATAWLLWVAAQGRAPLPFVELCVPALPLLGVAIQEALVPALDAPSMLWRRLGLFGLTIGLVASAIPSSEPTDVGPFALARWQRAWLAPRASARFGYAEALGREGLNEELERTRVLRGLGLFLRDRVDPAASVLTPWPGATGYLSRMALVDLGARACPIPGSARPQPWSRRSRTDVLAALRSDPPFDFVVPLLAQGEELPSPADLARIWRDELDSRAREPGRVEAIEAAFSEYELVTVPLRRDVRSFQPGPALRFALLRRKSLALAPQVEVQLDHEQFVVQIRHRAHEQIADLRVEVVDAAGTTRWLRPTGELVDGRPVNARSGLLLYDTGTRALEAVRAPLPQGALGVRAYLVNPGARTDQPYARVSATAEWHP